MDRDDYEYFQLYDPDDSDLDGEADPDVRAILASHARSLARQQRGGGRCCRCCHRS